MVFTWGLRRQLIYGLILVLFLGVFGFLIAYPHFNKPPTCFDSKQNGDETGMDCGGSCALACLDQQDRMSLLWSRAFRVVPGRYNAVAYIENHNPNVVVRKINYRFRFADRNNIYIGKREGSTYVPSSSRFAVFEPAIDMGNSVPVFTTFEFTETPVWVQVPPDKVNQLKVTSGDIELADSDTFPRLTAKLENNSLFIIPNMNVIAILYDADGNALSVSRTFIDLLNGGETKDITFTWPERIEGEVVAKEILPIFDLFSAKLK